MTAAIAEPKLEGPLAGLSRAFRRFGRRLMISRELSALDISSQHIADKDMVAARRAELTAQLKSL